MNFAANLRLYREKAGITAKDFAAKIGINYSTYSGYENQDREPKYEILLKIAAALHVTTDELLGYELDGRGVLLAWLEDMGFYVKTVKGVIRVFLKIQNEGDIINGWPYESWEELQKAVIQAKENAWNANKENIKNTLKSQFYKDLSEHIKKHGF